MAARMARAPQIFFNQFLPKHLVMHTVRLGADEVAAGLPRSIRPIGRGNYFCRTGQLAAPKFGGSAND